MPAQQRQSGEITHASGDSNTLNPGQLSTYYSHMGAKCAGMHLVSA